MTGPEVTAAMKAEDVDAGLVEKAARAMWSIPPQDPDSALAWPSWDVAVERADAGLWDLPQMVADTRNLARHALAAVLPHFAAVVAANTLEDAAENLDLPGSTAVGYYASEQHSGYGDAERDVERWLTHRAARIRAEDAARLTNATEEAK